MLGREREAVSIAMDLEREGGRGANQLRPMDCSRNVLSRAHGSASCSHGTTPFCMLFFSFSSVVSVFLIASISFCFSFL